VIGYYIHHVGRGHLHRALAAVSHVDEPVTALTSLPADPRWPGPWVTLARDDAGTSPVRPTAHGVLHWAPVQDHGLQARMAALAAWVARERPSVIVVDLSVEVLTLVRLMGVPVVAVTLPGRRDDAAHRLGYDLADAIVAPWPARYGSALAPELANHGEKVHYVGAVSRFDGRRALSSRVGEEGGTGSGSGRRVLVMTGAGGTVTGQDVRRHGPAAASEWEWRSIGPHNWVADPWPAICQADVVISHGGMGALADIAAARRPTIVVPQSRPHDEQIMTSQALDRAGLATVTTGLPHEATQWSGLLETALTVGGDGWAQWSTGDGGRRLADVVAQVARQSC
jgi:hypothetical protein